MTQFLVVLIFCLTDQGTVGPSTENILNYSLPGIKLLAQYARSGFIDLNNYINSFCFYY